MQPPQQEAQGRWAIICCSLLPTFSGCPDLTPCPFLLSLSIAADYTCPNSSLWTDSSFFLILGILQSVSLEIELLAIYIFVHRDHLNQSLKMFARSSAWPREKLLHKRKKNGRNSQHSLEMQLQEELSHLHRGKPIAPIISHLALAVHRELCVSYLPTLPNNPRFSSRLPTQLSPAVQTPQGLPQIPNQLKVALAAWRF